MGPWALDTQLGQKQHVKLEGKTQEAPAVDKRQDSARTEVSGRGRSQAGIWGSRLWDRPSHMIPCNAIKESWADLDKKS